MATVTVKATDKGGASAIAKVSYAVTGTPPPGGALMGMNFQHTATGQTQESMAHAARIYVPAGLTNISTLSEFNRAYALGVRVFVVSWKDTGTSTIGQMLDSFPADCTVYGVAHHEPEDDMTGAQFAALQAQHMPVVRAHGGIPASILMQWTLDPASKRTPSDWILPAGLIDVQGFDFYPKTLAYQAAGVTRMRTFLAQAGVSRWLVGEYGVVKSDPTLGVSLINDFKAKTTDAELELYWSAQVGSTTPDYHFSSQTAAAWFA